MIVIIDYGMGNPESILNMINKVGGKAYISSEIADVLNAKALILPGVGSFDNGIKKLKESGLFDAIVHKCIVDKVPFLGICLGMQLLFEKSMEGELKGFSFIEGKVVKFDNSNYKIPHMGWNNILLEKKSDLFFELELDSRFYFVHSYFVTCNNEFVLAKSSYGKNFICAVQKENIFGVQFHPEKSHKFGVQFFKNFVNIVC